MEYHNKIGDDSENYHGRGYQSINPSFLYRSNAINGSLSSSDMEALLDELLKNEDYLKRVRTEDLREEKWHRGVTWTE